MNLNIKSFYSFNTRAPAILGASFKNLKLVSVMTYEMALNYINANSYHANIYPSLPTGTVDNPESFNYFLFKTEDNRNVVMADAWIDDQSIVEQGSQTLVLELPKISNTDIGRIKNILTTMGILYNSKII